MFCSLKDQGKVFFVRLDSVVDHLDLTLMLPKLALYLKECLGELIWYFVLQNVNLVSYLLLPLRQFFIESRKVFLDWFKDTHSLLFDPLLVVAPGKICSLTLKSCKSALLLRVKRLCLLATATFAAAARFAFFICLDSFLLDFHGGELLFALLLALLSALIVCCWRLSVWLFDFFISSRKISRTFISLASLTALANPAQAATTLQPTVRS